MINRDSRLNTSSILVLFILCANLLSAQYEYKSPIVAWVGEDSITVDQFIGLFELNPRIQNSNSSGLTAARIDFLHTLVGNKLWAQYRQVRGTDTTLAERTAENELRMMFTLDYLYKKKIIEEAEPTVEELQSAYQKASKTLLVNYLYSQSEEEINNLYNLLKQGFEFEEILSERDEEELQDESVEINYGDYEKSIEDELYSLGAKNYSEPIHSNDGYYIFYISNILSKNLMDDKSRQEKNKEVKELLQKRNEDEVYNTFMKSVLSGEEVVVSKNLRDDLINQIDERKRNNLFKEIVDDTTYIMSSTDVLEIEDALGEQSLRRVLIKIDTLDISLKNFIRALVFTHSKLVFNKNSSQKFVRKKLSDYIQKLILYEEAKNYGFNNAEEVQNDLKLWTEYFSFESVRSSIIDTVNITDSMIAKAVQKIFEQTSDSTFLKDESKRKLISSQLIDKKVSKTLRYKTAELAKDVTIKINYGLLQSLETTYINSFAIRRLGFGGALPAVPIYFPNSGWVNPDNYERFILP